MLFRTQKGRFFAFKKKYLPTENYFWRFGQPGDTFLRAFHRKDIFWPFFHGQHRSNFQKEVKSPPWRKCLSEKPYLLFFLRKNATFGCLREFTPVACHSDSRLGMRFNDIRENDGRAAWATVPTHFKRRAFYARRSCALLLRSVFRKKNVKIPLPE